MFNTQVYSVRLFASQEGQEKRCCLGRERLSFSCLAIFVRSYTQPTPHMSDASLDTFPQDQYCMVFASRDDLFREFDVVRDCGSANQVLAARLGLCMNSKISGCTPQPESLRRKKRMGYLKIGQVKQSFVRRPSFGGAAHGSFLACFLLPSPAAWPAAVKHEIVNTEFVFIDKHTKKLYTALWSPRP